ncbi:DUF5361 domain-containing protein [Bifidobacterium adolescentis]|uniref:DUF5361 domain-containing protein n=1 Tax=Bifidobacterium adolescentis TaxID=1680 RepID=UPI0018992098|nr:DUF5361 domain-containing protein [Bifidobacterium adolescentis]MDB1547735.1 DUF5361 domain-containing protein [Bifidobacterium adolescentis]MDB1557221.1 DUF5361 domain-containing protein [Bifidobacterium adolescentis]
MMEAAPDALRADLQRFYGLDMDEIGYTVRVRRAADLAANLPEDALTWGRIDERATWGTAKHLLATIADNTGFIAWTKTKAAKQREWRGAIERPGFPRTANVQKLDPDNMLRILRMPRT